MIWTVITQRCKFSNGCVVETNVHHMQGPMDNTAALYTAESSLVADRWGGGDTFVRVVALVKGDHMKSTVVNDLM